MAQDTETLTLERTPLDGLHRALGARMVPFAGWDMPVQYAGVMAEHNATRNAAGLFDVSHMGQILIEGTGAAEALESVVPQAIVGLRDGRQRYAFFTNDNGGLIDDLMVSHQGDRLYLVVNASRVAVDLAHLRTRLPNVAVTHVTDRAMLALQGPQASAVLSRFVASADAMRFMDHRVISSDYGALFISRSGYTGEDGFEISVPADRAEALAQDLLSDEQVTPAGLGARDSLRLESGLCLYCSDIDEGTTPVAAGLGWAIQRVRRAGGDREGGFPGANIVLREFLHPPERLRVGLRPEGRAPMRAGVSLYETKASAEKLGQVTSGTFGPTLGAPVAMGYVPARLSAPGTRLFGEVRGKRLPVIVSPMPFHPHAYNR
ncbi:MAG: glycine cleavage system aminomethyltransferase GcvT [Pseudomonadota bacterium]